jgi:hypothetical protein
VSELVAGGVCGVFEMWAQLVLNGAAWRQSVVVGWVASRMLYVVIGGVDGGAWGW